jgi:Tol biopolymer transport system component
MDRTPKAEGDFVRSLGSRYGQRAGHTDGDLKTGHGRPSAAGTFGLLAVACGLVALIGAAPASAGNGCQPAQTIENRLPSDLVGASFTVAANTATYEFDSLVDRSPSGGIPGLIEYCVYPGSTEPDSVTVTATGDNGDDWQDPPAFESFSFVRPDGNPSNIPLDGTSTTMGTATWSGGVPPNQILVLHINDADECDELYNEGAETCWVLPSGTPPPQTPEVITEPHFKDSHDPVPPDGPYPNFQAPVGAEVHDSATVDGTSNGTPEGEVKFEQFDNGTCSGPPADTDTVDLSDGEADQAKNYPPLMQGDTLSFRASYNSSDTSKWAHSVSACEVITVVCQVAFASKRTGTGDIYLLESSTQRRLTTSPAFDGQPAFFTAAGRIAFASNRAGNSEIYSMSAGGKAQTRLTTEPAVDTQPSWSPDGTKIAFASARSGGGDVYVMNADGTDQVRLTTNQAADGAPAWSPDGTQIAFESARTGNGDVYVMNADGTGQRRLTANAAADTAPDWSPDGTRIAFASKRTGNGDIYVISGGTQTRLTTNPAVDREPSFSQHARTAGKIDFVSRRNGNFDLYALNATGAQWRLTTNPALDGAPDAP